MITLAICDDSQIDLDFIVPYLEEYCSENSSILQYDVFHSGKDLYQTITAGNTFSIYLLDILMPEMTGMALAKKIRLSDQSSRIVFLTSSLEYALQGYSVKASNYLLKPVTKEALFQTLDECIEALQILHTSSSICIKDTFGNLHNVLPSSIVYLEVIRKSVFFHLSNNTIIQTNMTLSSAKTLLKDKNCFISPHRSFYINMNYISTIMKKNIIMYNDTSIPLSRNNFNTVEKTFFDFTIEKNST